ncbi:MAG TPA: deoxyribodipyrimidine photo-lyase [Burkholderiaceae bacterium]|nr:deoxyribodipyrimidine photo-lyase [Burkholderiaceae bacterium]
MDSALVWFRRDLRLDDHAALHAALRGARRVHCAFVFDRDILDPLLAEGARADRRVEFIHGSVVELDRTLRAHGGCLLVRHGRAVDEIVRLADRLRVDAVFANHDDDPFALARDRQVAAALRADGRSLQTRKDHVVFERDEVMTAQGTPFSVFTPYRNAWLKKLAPFYLKAYPVERHLAALAPPADDAAVPDLGTLGFAPTNLAELQIGAGERAARLALEDFAGRIDRYAAARDFPSRKGPSYLSVHLRFGTLSIRRAAALAVDRIAHHGPDAEAARGAQAWLGELVWRDFYQMILAHHPRVVEQAFKPEYDRIRWADPAPLLDAWRDGRTGYPLVDAAMRQINRTGYMHNRLRMVVASFLTKDLGIDWRHGERYFARHLNDYDLASNNGGWQWAASSGCDAQPYFRIFNPMTQSERFDPDGAFIRRYLPQLAGYTAAEIHAPWRASPARQREAGCVIGVDYPAPVVDHAAARAATLQRYAVARDRAD